MLDNIQLFDDCLLHKEPLIDPYYCLDGLIISTSSQVPPSDLMIENQQILNRITAIQVALADGRHEELDYHLDQLRELLESPNINFSEFTSFFPTVDVSYSIYNNLALDDKKDFLAVVVKLYIEKRHSIYQSHGYTATTLQVRKDFEKHKTGGNAANIKLEKLLLCAGYSKAESATDILDGRKRFLFLKRARLQKNILTSLRAELQLEFEWQKAHQGKNADLIFVDASGQIFICEFKHMKETGGGQDKQVSELISLVRGKEKNPRLGYLSFLDGIYFNSFIDPISRKAIEQVSQIRNALAENPRNYFVNTWGVQKIIKSQAVEG